MSHFTVAVFDDGNKTVEELLAPYQENNMSDCPKEYLEFHDVAEEKRQEYKDSYQEFVRTDNGELLNPWNNSLYTEVSEEEYLKLDYRERKADHLKNKYYKKDIGLVGRKIIKIPSKVVYPIYEDYLESEGYEIDKETKKYGYWENPNAKWDYWDIGGRWSNMLETIRGDFVDSEKMKNLVFVDDFKAYKKAIRFWEIYIDGRDVEPGEDYQEPFYRKEYFIDRYHNKETYAKIQSMFYTHSVITPDGKWHEIGEMGWFGCSSENHDEAMDWYLHYRERFIDTANPEWTLTIVDCHI